MRLDTLLGVTVYCTLVLIAVFILGLMAYVVYQEFYERR